MAAGGKLTIETANRRLEQHCGRLHGELPCGNYVMLAVSDTGSGLDETTRAGILEPFLTTKGEGCGTGLGLALTRDFVQQSGGRVFVYSEPGLGSTFKIHLPECQDAALVRHGTLPSAAAFLHKSFTPPALVGKVQSVLAHAAA